MIRHLCPTCEMVIQSADNLAGLPVKCPHCHAPLTVPRETIHNPKTDDSGFYATSALARAAALSGRHPAESKMTAKWRHLLREVYPRCDEFSILVTAEERPAGRWLFLSPLVWGLRGKVYVVGFRSADHTLCLFRVRRSLMASFTGFLETEEVPLGPNSELIFEDHILPPVSKLQFRDKEGKKRILTFGMPAKADAKALFESIHMEEARTPVPVPQGE